MAETVWYVGYGSNLSEDRFTRYLGDEDGEGRPAGLVSRWVDFDYPVYFAGTSRNWGGAVAFCGLVPAAEPATSARAYAVSVDELTTVLAQENGRRSLSWALPDSEVGEWTPLPVSLADDGFAGKYNAVLRLPDIDGSPAFTVTTSHVLPLADPTPEYLEVITTARADRAAADLVEAWVAPSVSGDNREYLASWSETGLASSSRRPSVATVC